MNYLLFIIVHRRFYDYKHIYNTIYTFHTILFFFVLKNYNAGEVYWVVLMCHARMYFSLNVSLIMHNPNLT